MKKVIEYNGKYLCVLVSSYDGDYVWIDSPYDATDFVSEYVISLWLDCFPGSKAVDFEEAVRVWEEGQVRWIIRKKWANTHCYLQENEVWGWLWVSDPKRATIIPGEKLSYWLEQLKLKARNQKDQGAEVVSQDVEIHNYKLKENAIVSHQSEKSLR